MGKEGQAPAMEIDDPKSNASDQIFPKFSINGLFFRSDFSCFLFDSNFLLAF